MSGVAEAAALVCKGRIGVVIPWLSRVLADESRSKYDAMGPEPSHPGSVSRSLGRSLFNSI